MDPLSDLLSVLDPDAYAAAGFDFGGAWSVAFPRQAGVKCFAVLSGQGWLMMEGVETPVFARAGDCLVLPHGRAFRVASDLALAPIDATTLYSASPDAGLTLYQGGGDTTGFASHFELAGPAAGFLLEGLPPILHMREESQRATLRWCLERDALARAASQPSLPCRCRDAARRQAGRPRLRHGRETPWAADRVPGCTRRFGQAVGADSRSREADGPRAGAGASSWAASTSTRRSAAIR